VCGTAPHLLLTTSSGHGCAAAVKALVNASKSMQMADANTGICRQYKHDASLRQGACVVVSLQCKTCVRTHINLPVHSLC
jgi:hypothetical protein